MKTIETTFKARRKHFVIMVLCFLYGGFAIILFLLLLYTSFWRTEIFGFSGFEERFQDVNRFSRFDGNHVNGFGRTSFNPISLISSPLILTFLGSGLISLFAGISIWSLIREKEIKSIKEQTANNLLLPDERMIIDALKESDYELTQSKLSKELGLNKVQVHRAIKRLEAKGVLKKHEYGLTNKIILKKEFFE